MKKRILVLAVAALLIVGAGGVIVWSYLAHRDEQASDEAADASIKSPAKVGEEAGEPVVTLDDATQQRMGVKTQPIEKMTRRRQVVAYGALEEDPAGSFVLRAPLAGTVQGATGGWPDTGSTLADGAQIGRIEPRLQPADRVNINDRLASAQADVEASQSALTTAQTAAARIRSLNADNKNVSDRAVQEADAQVAAEQAKLNGAKHSVQLLTAALASQNESSVPLEMTRGGIVVEVLAHPGESVESGQAILRVARFDRLLAHVDVPPGETVAPDLKSATIVPLGHENEPITGERVGYAAEVDPKTQGQPFVFRVSDSHGALRPGLSVTAYLEAPGEARAGAVVPRNAVIWQSGKSWVYVQTANEKFARRAVTLEDPASGGWFTESLKPGDKVVTQGGQMMLSEEFKSQIRIEDEN